MRVMGHQFCYDVKISCFWISQPHWSGGCFRMWIPSYEGSIVEHDSTSCAIFKLYHVSSSYGFLLISPCCTRLLNPVICIAFWLKSLICFMQYQSTAGMKVGGGRCLVDSSYVKFSKCDWSTFMLPTLRSRIGLCTAVTPKCSGSNGNKDEYRQTAESNLFQLLARVLFNPNPSLYSFWSSEGEL